MKEEKRRAEKNGREAKGREEKRVKRRDDNDGKQNIWINERSLEEQDK